MTFIPTILSGGSGTRLWPVSRTKFPKQFCELFEESLFKKTLVRLKPLGSPWVITNEALKILTETVMRETKVPLEQALYEPKANNTAPAIALLCQRPISPPHSSPERRAGPSAPSGKLRFAIQCAMYRHPWRALAQDGTKKSWRGLDYLYVPI